MASKLLKSFLRLWFMKYNSFSNVNKSSMGAVLTSEFNKSEFTNIYDFTFNCIGYERDENLSPYHRYMKRREIMENISDSSYWKSQARELGVVHTSEVVDVFKHLNVQGLGQEYVSIQSNSYHLPYLPKFLEENEELVKVFCSGVDVLNTRLFFESGKPVPAAQLVKKLNCTSSKEFEKKCKELKLNFSKVFNLVPSSAIKVCGNRVYLHKETIAKYGEETIQKFLVYSAVMKSDRIPINYSNLFVNYITKTFDVFNLSDVDYLYLLDLGFLLGLPVGSLLNVVGFEIPDIEDMLKKSNGIYMLKYPDVTYIPKSLSDDTAVPCCIDLDTFCDLFSHNNLSEIIYNNGLPYLNGARMF